MSVPEWIAIGISSAALVFSALAYFNQRKQTKIMAAKKFTDDPINAYTVKLESIRNAIDRVADELSGQTKQR